MEELRFEVEGTDSIKLANQSYPIKSIYNVAPDSFIVTFEKIAKIYKFSLTDEFFKRISTTEMEVNGKTQKVLFGNSLGFLVHFFLASNILLDKGIEVKPLISELLKSGGDKEFMHSYSLSILTAAYAMNGYSDMRFGGKTDFEICGLLAELKVIHLENPYGRFEKAGVKQLTPYIADDVCYDIGQALQNRLPEAIAQFAEIVFIDLSSKSLESIFMPKLLHSNENMTPEPRRHRIVFFARTGPYFFVKREGTSSFWGTYVDFDPTLWNSLRERKRRKMEVVGSL